jgi:hypothetical protein
MWYSYYSIGYTILFGTLVIFACFIERTFDKAKASFTLFILNTISFLIVAIPALVAKSKAVNVDYFGERDSWAAIVNSTTLLHYITPFPSSLEDKIAKFLFEETGSRSALGLQDLMNTSGLFTEGWIAATPWGLLVLIVFIGTELLRSGSLERNLKLPQIKVFYGAGFIALSMSLVGGLGSVIAIAFSGVLRGYARYAIFALILFVISIAIYIASQAQKKNAYRTLVTLLMVTCAGMTFNQTPLQAGATTSQYLQTLNVEKSLEARSGCTILQLPVIHFPYESPGFPTYRLMRFGLISDRYNWSSGFVGGSPAHADMLAFKEAQRTTLKIVIRLARANNYCGVLIDENAWNSVAEYKPWPEYKPQVGTLTNFMQPGLINQPVREFQTDDTNYFWIAIE